MTVVFDAGQNSEGTGAYSFRPWVRPRGALTDRWKPSGMFPPPAAERRWEGPAIEAAVQLSRREGGRVAGQPVTGRERQSVQLGHPMVITPPGGPDPDGHQRLPASRPLAVPPFRAILAGSGSRCPDAGRHAGVIGRERNRPARTAKMFFSGQGKNSAGEAGPRPPAARKRSWLPGASGARGRLRSRPRLRD